MCHQSLLLFHFQIILLINVISGKISLDIVTEKEVRDLKLIAELDPEYVAASFVGNAKDIERVRIFEFSAVLLP